MGLLRTPLWIIGLTITCYLGQVLAVPSLFRRPASTAPMQAPSAPDLSTLDLDPAEQLAIFGNRGMSKGSASARSIEANFDVFELDQAGASLAQQHQGQECYAQIYDQVKAECARGTDMSPDERMLGE